MGRENCWKNHYTFLNVENNAGWRQYAKSVLSQNTIISIHPSWLMLFMLFWALQAEKFYLSQHLTRSMGVNIAVQGNLWHFFFNSAMHLQIFELCCPAFGKFPKNLKNWICFCIKRQVAIKDQRGCSPEGCGIWEIQLRDALQSVSSLMQCKAQAQTATHILQAKLWGVTHSWKKTYEIAEQSRASSAIPYSFPGNKLKSRDKNLMKK